VELEDNQINSVDFKTETARSMNVMIEEEIKVVDTLKQTRHCHPQQAQTFPFHGTTRTTRMLHNGI
jgi:hypothetical protein